MNKQNIIKNGVALIAGVGMAIVILILGFRQMGEQDSLGNYILLGVTIGASAIVIGMVVNGFTKGVVRGIFHVIKNKKQ